MICQLSKIGKPEYVSRDGPREGTALVPNRSGALLVDCPAGNWPESLLNLPSEQDGLVILEMTTLTSTDPLAEESDTDDTDFETPSKCDDPTDKGPHDDSHTHVLLRHSSRLTRNQLLKRYQNFVLQQSNIFSDVLDICNGLCVCFHLIPYVYIIFFGNIVWSQSIHIKIYLPNTNNFLHWWSTIHVDPMVEIWMGSSGPKDIWSKHNYLTITLKDNSP